MEPAKIHPSPETLARLTPFDQLSREQLELLSRALQVHRAQRGEQLMEVGDTAAFNLYLINGRISLRSADGRLSELDEASPQALGPIAKLIPRQYDVTSLTPVDYLIVDNSLLQGLASAKGSGITALELEEEPPQSAIESENLLSRSLLEDLQNDHLVLPSLPSVAIRVGRAMEEETTNAARLAKIIQADPAITAKLIRIANSALYAGVTPIETCSDAVVRLGSKTTHQLVLTFALRELFKTRSKVLEKRMQQLWRHSVKVSAICYVLAKLTGRFNPEHALLAGLLHDIGGVAILSYAERFPGLTGDEVVINHVIQDLRGPIGSRLLKAWAFSDDLIQVAENAEEWLRDHSGPADYTDLVIIAQLHCLIGTPLMHKVPALDQVPAFQKLELGELTPRKSLKIVEKAEERVGQVEDLLR